MAEIAMVRDLAVLAWKKIRLENLELRFILSRLNEPLSFLDKHDTKFLLSHQVESILDQLCDYTGELKKEVELSLSYAAQLQANGATAADLEGLEKTIH
jgi:hypothetical protein